MRKLSVILLAFVMSVLMVVPAFAEDYNGTALPDITPIINANVEQYPYYSLHVVDQDIVLFMTVEPFYIGINNGAFVSRPESNAKVNGIRYRTDRNRTEWFYENTAGGYWTTYLPFWANYDVYNADGSLYLKGWVPPQPPKPLSESIIELAGDTINNDTIPSVISAMTILCVTGIGLLAMLVLLKLFGKRSLIKR